MEVERAGPASEQTEGKRQIMIGNFGINSDSIGYEVALEVLGQKRQPYMNALHEERLKSVPSQSFIRYCEACLKAIDELQDALMPNDKTTIERILNQHQAFTTH